MIVRIPSVPISFSLFCSKDRPSSRLSRSPWNCQTFTTSPSTCPRFPRRLAAPRNPQEDIGLLQCGRTNQRCLSNWLSRRVWSKAVSSEMDTGKLNTINNPKQSHSIDGHWIIYRHVKKRRRIGCVILPRDQRQLGCGITQPSICPLTCTVFGWKVKTRLPLAAGASSRNLVFTF